MLRFVKEATEEKNQIVRAPSTIYLISMISFVLFLLFEGTQKKIEIIENRAKNIKYKFEKCKL